MSASVRAVAGALVAAAGCVVGPVPAAAATVVPTPMHVVVVSRATSHEVCVHGESVSPDSRFELSIAGGRMYDYVSRTGEGAAPADLSNEVIDQRVTYPVRILDACVTVPWNGADAGHFQATLAYVGTSGDVIGALVGRGTWALGRADANSTYLG